MANVAFKGFVGKVHGLKFNNDGKPRFSFSVAEGHSRFNKQTNEWEDIGTTWWATTVFGKQAEDLADVIGEGKKQQVVVVGRSSTREYEKDGETSTSLDVIADHAALVHRANQPSQPPQNAPQQSWGGGQQAQHPQDPWSGQQSTQGGFDLPQSGPAPF